MVGCRIGKGGEIRYQVADKENARRWKPVAGPFSARILNGVGRLEARNNTWASLAIAEFPSFEQAVARCEDQEYRGPLPFARKAYDRDLAIAEGT